MIIDNQVTHVYVAFCLNQTIIIIKDTLPIIFIHRNLSRRFERASTSETVP